MSSLRFTITENDPFTYFDSIHSLTTSAGPYTTVIDEPVGLDSINLHIKRDDTYHGFLDAVDDSLGSLKFYNLAYSILKYAYITYGLEAQVSLLIEFACSDTDGYSTLYEGVYSFDKYKEVQGLEGCYIEASIENGQALMLFRNRMDTKVCLDSTTGMGDGYDDGSIVPLTAYDGLGQQVMLNPMLIDLVDNGTIATGGDGSLSYYYQYSDSGSNLVPCPGNPTFYDQTPGDSPISDAQNNEFYPGGGINCIVVTPFTTIQQQDFGTFAGGIGDTYYGNNVGIPGSGAQSLTHHGWGLSNLSDPTPFFVFSSDLVYESNMVNIDIELSGALFAGRLDHTSGDSTSNEWPEINIGIYKGQTWGSVSGHGANFYDFANPTNTNNNQGCIIDMQTLVNNHVLGTPGLVNPLPNDTPTGTINSQQFQYSFHTSTKPNPVLFNPGDQLWILVELTFCETISPMLVFFSDTYTFRNSYDSSLFPSTTTQVNGAPGYPTPPITLPVGSNATWPAVVTTLTKTVTASTPLSYFKISFPSLFQSTPATAYMVNESLSRIAEVTTNGALSVYSEYFGRTDSQPYANTTSLGDGAGGLECITTGLLIRGYSPLAALQMSTDSPTLWTETTPYTLSSTTPLYASTDSNILLFSGGTITVPEDLTYITPIGTQIIIQQVGPNATSIVGGTIGTGGTVSVASTSGGTSTFGQNSQVLLTKVGINSWLLSSRSTMIVSFKELFDAVHAIHAVGFGDEPAPDGSGNTVIRVEPISYFYQPLLPIQKICDNVDIVETSVDTPNIINTFKSGYQKWEAEASQGLDDFLSRRFFRTTLFHVRNAWDKICKFVASGYAVEATRRKLGTDTTDWRFDNENFIICLQRGGGPGLGSGATANAVLNGSGGVLAIDVITAGSGYVNTAGIPTPPTVTLSYGDYTTLATATAIVSTSSPYGISSITVTYAGAGYSYPPTVTIMPAGTAGGFSTEQGNAVGSTSSTYSPAQGLISAATVYNYRISPIRNALRWLRYIIASYSNWATGQLIFESGGGNYTAVGYNASVNDGTPITIDMIDTAKYTIESRLLSESDTLTMSAYAGTVAPVYTHELVKFKYPVSYTDWQNITSGTNRYALIQYSVNGGSAQYGYLQELKYNLIEGMGEFTLRPKA